MFSVSFFIYSVFSFIHIIMIKNTQLQRLKGKWNRKKNNSCYLPLLTQKHKKHKQWEFWTGWLIISINNGKGKRKMSLPIPSIFSHLNNIDLYKFSISYLISFWKVNNVVASFVSVLSLFHFFTPYMYIETHPSPLLLVISLIFHIFLIHIFSKSFF